MTLSDDTQIAGAKTVADWKAMKERLDRNPDTAIWEEAFSEFFEQRLKTRYFEPIEAIVKTEKETGEGFAIVALHCTLIEFLGATLEGKTYKYRGDNDPPLGDHEYNKSRKMFVDFLVNNEPFNRMFSSGKSAEEFYANVRCGLLHEACTKGGWKIRVSKSDGQAIDVKEKVVYRDKMQAAFDQFIKWYGKKLTHDAKLQCAFIRKFDSLCRE